MSRSALWRQEGAKKQREKESDELFELAVEEGRVSLLLVTFWRCVLSATRAVMPSQRRKSWLVAAKDRSELVSWIDIRKTNMAFPIFRHPVVSFFFLSQKKKKPRITVPRACCRYGDQMIHSILTQCCYRTRSDHRTFKNVVVT